MARVNITVPDDVLARAREAELNISRLATSAVEDALDRLLKLKMLDDYLADLDAELGPDTPEEVARAQRVVGEIEAALGTPGHRRARTTKARPA